MLGTTPLACNPQGAFPIENFSAHNFSGHNAKCESRRDEHFVALNETFVKAEIKFP